MTTNPHVYVGQDSSREGPETDAEAMRDPAEVQKCKHIVEVFLDVLQLKDGEELSHGIAKKLWLGVRTALPSAMVGKSWLGERSRGT